MKKNHYLYLKSKTWLVAMFFIVFPMCVNAAAGKVEFASGGAALQSADGSSKVLVKGMDINAGDTIVTGTGRAQVKFIDGGYMSFQPDTQFKVEEYNFNGKQDGTEKGFFRLIKGGLRAVTGLVGRENRPAYRLATPVATIGIRGSYFLADFHEKLKAHCGHGSIYVFNEQGDIILFEGQSAEVEVGGAPRYSDEELTLGARGPEGGQPASDNQQQLAEGANNIFKLAEQYNRDGVSCNLTGGCAISGVMANLNGTNAIAYYMLDSSVANVGGGSGWTSKVGSASLYANFGNYSMSGSIGIDSSKIITGDGTYTISAHDYFNVSGSILPSAVFGLSSNYHYSDGSVCNGQCTLNVIGAFSGAHADKAGIGYVVKGVDGGSNITGTAGIVVNRNYND
ncbi:MAG: FecR family protein [Pseudomonadota bacterium]